MALEQLQSTLNRMAQIQSFFEAAQSDRTTEFQPENAFSGILEEHVQENGPASGSSGSSTTFEPVILKNARENGIDNSLLKAIIHQESGFNTHAVSSAGAQGLMQLMPTTAETLGVKNSFDPEQNIAGGSRYLKKLLNRYDQSLPKALAAYNAGPGNVDRFGGVPPFKETQHYVQNVLKTYHTYQLQQGQLQHGGNN
jgi:soluble lytic murein transglycosylase-like protein